MSKLYENETTLATEEVVAQKLKKAYSIIPVKLPRSYRVDWAFTKNNEVVAWAELKYRSHSFGDYPDLFISLSKYMAGCELKQRTEKPFYILGHFNNGLYSWKHDYGDECKIMMGGRMDRGDPADQEPMVHILNEYFKKLDV